jgi:chromosome segregation ATPase
MRNFHLAEDSASNLLERRWFAADRAAAEVQSECDALARALDLTQAALREARARCSHLEALRDALGDELAAVDQRVQQRVSPPARRSAA